MTESERLKRLIAACAELREVGVLVTDYVTVDQIKGEYDDITDEQATEALNNIDVGDYDTAVTGNYVSSDARRRLLDKAVREAGYDLD